MAAAVCRELAMLTPTGWACVAWAAWVAALRVALRTTGVVQLVAVATKAPAVQWVHTLLTEESAHIQL